jgi:hypothetical protein
MLIQCTLEEFRPSMYLLLRHAVLLVRYASPLDHLNENLFLLLTKST